MSTLTEVLRAHLPRDRYDDEGHSAGTFCTCGGWTGDYFADGEAGPFDEHLASAMLAWVAERAGDAATIEHVANFVPLGFDPKRDPYGSVGEAARSILLAFVGSVAPELAPESHRTSPVSDFDATDGLGEVQR